MRLNGKLTFQQIENIKLGSVIEDHGFGRREMILFNIVERHGKPYSTEFWVLYMSSKGYSRTARINGYDEFLADQRFSLVIE